MLWVQASKYPRSQASANSIMASLPTMVSVKPTLFATSRGVMASAHCPSSGDSCASVAPFACSASAYSVPCW